MNLHPGVAIALQRLGSDELGVARMMVAGDLASPQQYENIALFAMRVTGSGVAYRQSLDEFVFRDPALYCNADFLARCSGLPVIWEHPAKSTLDSKEFASRIVGTVFLPYIQGDEVWAIAKIWDTDAAKLMEDGELSTSPSVVFRDPSANSTMQMDDGSVLLIEGKPSLLDHLAICEKGVWDKGGPAVGVRSDSVGKTIMDDEEKKAAEMKKADADREEKERSDKAKADADGDAGTKLDKLLSMMDSVCGRMDAMDKRMDSVTAKADAKKDDDPAKDEPAKADKRKDSEDEEDEKKKRADADMAKRFSDMENLVRNIPRPVSDSDEAATADAQAKADSVYNGFGKRAPRPMVGETPIAYRLRMLRDFQQYSPEFKDAKLDLVARADALTFGAIETKIYADSVRASASPQDMEPFELREVRKVNPDTNLTYREFKGRQTFIAGMSPVKSYATKFNTQRDRAA